MKTISMFAIGALSVASFVSCHPDPVYVPVYYPTQTKVTTKAKPKPVYRAPAPRKESAEDFRAVEKPSTYSY